MKSIIAFHDYSVLIESSLCVLCLLTVCARCTELLAHATLVPFQAGKEFCYVCPSQVGRALMSTLHISLHFPTCI